MTLPLESALLLAAATAVVPEPLRTDWRREWNAELWWWLSSSPHPTRRALARHCWGALVDACWLRSHSAACPFRDFLPSPAGMLAVALLSLALLAAASHGFRSTRRALFGAGPGAHPERLAILYEASPFMGGMIALSPARLAGWAARSQTLESISPASPATALCRLKPGISLTQAETELRGWNGFLHLAPYASILYRSVVVLGPAFLALAALALLNWLRSANGRAFLLAQPLAALTLLFLAAMEIPASPAALLLPYLTASFLALRYCWSDQRRRCPECHARLALPVRIGLGPRLPFEPVGTELLCPQGHGALFTTLEEEPEAHWTRLVA